MSEQRAKKLPRPCIAGGVVDMGPVGMHSMNAAGTGSMGTLMIGVQLEFADIGRVGLIPGNPTGTLELGSVDAPGIGLGLGRLGLWSMGLTKGNGDLLNHLEHPFMLGRNLLVLGAALMIEVAQSA